MNEYFRSILYSKAEPQFFQKEVYFSIMIIHYHYMAMSIPVLERAMPTSSFFEKAKRDEPVTSGRIRKIIGKIGDEYFVLSPEEVMAFEADGDLVWIFTERKKFLASYSLKYFQQQLGDLAFRRVHRSSLVNLDHVRKMSSLSSQRWLLTMNNGQEFVVSKRQVGILHEIFRY